MPQMSSRYMNGRRPFAVPDAVLPARIVAVMNIYGRSGNIPCVFYTDGIGIAAHRYAAAAALLTEIYGRISVHGQRRRSARRKGTIQYFCLCNRISCRTHNKRTAAFRLKGTAVHGNFTAIHFERVRGSCPGIRLPFVARYESAPLNSPPSIVTLPPLTRIPLPIAAEYEPARTISSVSVSPASTCTA